MQETQCKKLNARTPFKEKSNARTHTTKEDKGKRNINTHMRAYTQTYDKKSKNSENYTCMMIR